MNSCSTDLSLTFSPLPTYFSPNDDCFNQTHAKTTCNCEYLLTLTNTSTGCLFIVTKLVHCHLLLVIITRTIPFLRVADVCEEYSSTSCISLQLNDWWSTTATPYGDNHLPALDRLEQEEIRSPATFCLYLTRSGSCLPSLASAQFIITYHWIWLGKYSMHINTNIITVIVASVINALIIALLYNCGFLIV